MQKTTKIIIAIIAVIAVVAIIAMVAATGSESKSNLQINNVEDLSALVDKIYEGQEMQLPMLSTNVIDTTDNDLIKMITGLDNANNLDYVVASEPMMTSQAYSLVLVKVKDGVNVNEVAKNMNENIDARKWICVTAEKVYTTSSGNIVCLVMSSKEVAQPIYEKFKTLAGNVGEEFERTEQEPELPADMY